MLDGIHKSEHVGLRILRHASLSLDTWSPYFDVPTMDSLATTIMGIAAQAIINEEEPNFKPFLESGQIEAFKEIDNE